MWQDQRAIGHLQILLDLGVWSKHWLKKYEQKALQALWFAD